MKTANLAIRFILEVVALVIYGVWGYHLTDSNLQIILAIAFPLGFAVLWGVFAVRGDPSRSGKTVVPTPGWIRLMLEIILFGVSVWMVFDLDYFLPGIIFGLLLVVHYAVSYERIVWLFKQPSDLPSSRN